MVIVVIVVLAAFSAVIVKPDLSNDAVKALDNDDLPHEDQDIPEETGPGPDVTDDDEPSEDPPVVPGNGTDDGDDGGENGTKPPVEPSILPPTNLTYDPSVLNLTVDTTMDPLTPAYDGDEVKKWSVAPALPTGLAFDHTTGAISGTPGRVQANTEYTVTAKNQGGSDETVVTITVADIPPGGITYPKDEYRLTKGIPMKPVLPEVAGGAVTSWELARALPDGITLNPRTGRVSGSPTVLQGPRDYTIYGNNTGGTASATISFEVIDVAPSNLTYDPLDLVLTVDEPLGPLSPAYDGGNVVTWEIDAPLPAGLELNLTTGELGGTPTELAPLGQYEITGTNTGGSDSATVNVTVIDIPPEYVDYPEDYLFAAKDRAIDELVPETAGGNITDWAVTPPLPGGLALDPETGAISGEPTGRTPLTEYTITAKNTGGGVNTTLNIMTHDLELDRAEITAGIGDIHPGGGYPSRLVLHGEFAVSIVRGGEDKVIGAAAHYGAGRLVGYGHESMITWTQSGYDNHEMAKNALEWAAGDADPLIGLSPGMSGFGTYLGSQGYDYAETTPGNLAGFDVFLTNMAEYPDGELTQLQQFIWNGGGLVAGGQAWWWSYSNDDVPNEFPGNKLVPQAGVSWTERWLRPEGYNVDGVSFSMLTNALWGMEALLEDQLGTQTLSQEELDLAAVTVDEAVAFLPLSFEEFYEGVYNFEQTAGPISITLGNPFDLGADTVDDLLLRINNTFQKRLPPDELFAHMNAADFPGAVPGTAQTVKENLIIDGNYSGYDTNYVYSGAGAPVWRSTGLYARPGVPVTVTIPQSLTTAGLDVQIGSHTDGLWGKDTLNRHPEIVRRYDLDSQKTKAGNAFGGLVYIRVPWGSALGEFDVTINGAVRAPRYVHGETDVAQWTSTIRNYPGPWAEVGSHKIIFQVPSSVIRNLADPDDLMDFWDAVQDANADLSNFSRDRPRAERFGGDRQISVGWMHSGYPIGYFDSYADELMDHQLMSTQGSWGPFHELGHNHQWSDWILPGTTEVTSNLWSVYVMEEVVGIPRWVCATPLHNDTRRANMEDHFATGSSYDNWTSKGAVAFVTFIQLEEGFGWEAYGEVFTQYRNLSENDRPSGDQEKIDLWVYMFSNVTKKDLGPFFTNWGLPVSQAVLDEVAQFEPWLEDPLRDYFEYPANVSTLAASEITQTTATLNFLVSDNGHWDANASVYWGTTDGGMAPGGWDSHQDLGNISSGLNFTGVTGLTASTTYYYRVQITTMWGTYWSDVMGFVTTA